MHLRSAGDVLLFWMDQGIEQYMMRDGSSSRMGCSEGEGFTWCSCLGWRERLEAENGNLSLVTNSPGPVRGLGNGEGPSTGPVTFRIQHQRFTVVCTVFSCRVLNFSPAKGFLLCT